MRSAVPTPRSMSAGTAAATRPAPPGTNLIVTYHYVRDQNSDGVVGVTPETFRRHVRAIRQHFEVVTADDYVQRHALERGLALVTFDDAVRDQFVAAEILDELGCPGVFFAPMRPYADAPDGWTTQHLLHALAHHLGWRELEARLAPYLADVVVDEAAMNRLYHYEAPEKRRLKYALAFALSPAQCRAALSAINANVGLQAADWFMTADQLRSLQDAGHALGGHGFDHVPYSTLTPEAQRVDIQRAADEMNLRFGRRPRTFAYPYGRETPETAAMIRAAGFTFTFGTSERVDAKFFPEFFQQRGLGELS